MQLEQIFFEIEAYLVAEYPDHTWKLRYELFWQELSDYFAFPFPIKKSSLKNYFAQWRMGNLEKYNDKLLLFYLFVNLKKNKK